MADKESYGKKYKLGAMNVKTFHRSKEDVEFVEETLMSAIDSGEYDILVAPEHAYNTNEVMTENELLEIADKYIKQIGNKKMLVLPGTAMVEFENKYMENVLPIIISEGGGKAEVKYYSKKYDWNEKSIAKRRGLEWRNGKNPSVFEWDKKSIGVEICADHMNSALAEYYSDLDLQIIVSEGMSIDAEKIAVKPGGSIINCDGVSANEAERLTNESEDKLTSIPPKKTGGGIWSYSIEF